SPRPTTAPPRTKPTASLESHGDARAALATHREQPPRRRPRPQGPQPQRPRVPRPSRRAARNASRSTPRRRPPRHHPHPPPTRPPPPRHRQQRKGRHRRPRLRRRPPRRQPDRPPDHRPRRAARRGRAHSHDRGDDRGLMTITSSATINPAPPLRGARSPAKEAAVRIVIPGRPQSRERNGDGRDNRPAAAYVDAVRTAAKQLGLGHRGHPLVPHGHVHVDVTLVYTSDQTLPPTAWPNQSIPNADTAASLILKALTGLAWTHATQANPLVTTRRVITPAESRALYGST